jgi:transcriptional regulator with XRE-family HTH domain
MATCDFALVVEGLVATGMPQNCIARSLGVSPSTVCRWREGLAEPRVRTADALLELAEAWTARKLEMFQKRNPA